MNTKKVTFRYIILIPHRDARNRLDEYRQKLFGSRVPGAFSFPAAAPLAEVSKSFSQEELKELAQNIRRLTVDSGGKILSAGTSDMVKTRHFSFFGPALNLSIGEESFPETAREKIVRVFNPPKLCAAIVQPDDKPIEEPLPAFGSMAGSAAALLALSFRAAALANLDMLPLASGVFRNEVSSVPGYSYEWKMSPPVWLPKAGD